MRCVTRTHLQNAEGVAGGRVSEREPDADEVAARLEAGAAVAALAIVREHARETPVLVSGTLSERFGARVLLKAENLQRTGSFKIRGGYVRLSRLTPEERARGVVDSGIPDLASNSAHLVSFGRRDR